MLDSSCDWRGGTAEREFEGGTAKTALCRMIPPAELSGARTRSTWSCNAVSRSRRRAGRGVDCLIGRRELAWPRATQVICGCPDWGLVERCP
eukprot:7207000-Prymnesium_polylepis.1